MDHKNSEKGSEWSDSEIAKCTINFSKSHFTCFAEMSQFLGRNPRYLFLRSVPNGIIFRGVFPGSKRLVFFNFRSEIAGSCRLRVPPSICFVFAFISRVQERNRQRQLKTLAHLVSSQSVKCSGVAFGICPTHREQPSNSPWVVQQPFIPQKPKIKRRKEEVAVYTRL